MRQQPHTSGFWPIYILVSRKPKLQACLDEGFGARSQRILSRPDHGHRAVRSVPGGRTEVVVVFLSDQVGQQVAIRPTLITRLRPEVIIPWMAAHKQAAVHRTRPAYNLASWHWIRHFGGQVA